MSPHNVVMKAVVQFGTAIHGKRFSGCALNRFQKIMHVAKSPRRPALKYG
jgi:hypothetical protein